MRRYFLPALSGILLALTFYPFYFWPLALVALAPLYYFAQFESRSRRELFVGGCITGLLFCVPLYYFTLAQLISGFGGAFYTGVIRALSIPAAVLESALVGFMVLGWGSLRGRSPLLNVLAAAACYVVLERLITLLFGGYYPDSLAAAVVSLPGALAASSLAGMPFVSFLAAAAACSIAEAARAWREGRIHTLRGLGSAWLVCISAVGFSQALPNEAPRGSLAISIIQQVPASRPELLFGSFERGLFKAPLLRARIEDAQRGSDLVIYPYSPVEGDLTEVEDAVLGAWLANFTSTSSVILWNSTKRDGRLYTEYALWRAGEESVYQKRELYALSDYSPWWAQIFGVEKSPDAVSPGTSTQSLLLKDFALQGLICSELHQDGYARAQGARADLLLAAGVDAFFPGRLMGRYSLAVARYRAAENGVPLIRANLFGPSALINADGSLEATLPYAKRGILRGTLEIKKVPTLYRRAGEWPVYALISLTIAAALYRRIKFPYSAGRR